MKELLMEIKLEIKLLVLTRRHAVVRVQTRLDAQNLNSTHDADRATVEGCAEERPIPILRCCATAIRVDRCGVGMLC